MKGIIVSTIMLLVASTTMGQTLDEWLRQKETQKKYLIQQIAALKVLGHHYTKGYEIARDGLAKIGGITDGEFNLHKDHFRSLQYIPKSVKEDSRVEEIKKLGTMIRRIAADTYVIMEESQMLTDEEMQYIKRVYFRLVASSNQSVIELNRILSPQRLEMTEAQRLGEIGKIHAEMQSKYEFARRFSSQSKVIAAGRRKAQQEVDASRKMNGIQNH